MGGGASKFFDSIAGAAGDLIDNTVTAANIVGGYIEDGFEQAVNLAEDITRLGGMLLQDTLAAAMAAGKKYYNALVREAKRKAQKIKDTATAAANISKNALEDAWEDGTGAIVDTANSAAGNVTKLGKDIGGAIESTANDFANEMENTANTMKDGIVEVANVAEGELTGVVEDTVEIAESGLNFLVSQDWFNMDWANDFLSSLFRQFDRLTNIKFTSKSNKKSAKKEIVEQDSSDPTKTSQIQGYKNEPELIDENGKLNFKLVNDDKLDKQNEKFKNSKIGKENFTILEKRFNRKKIWILILLFILIFLLILNCSE